MSNRWRKWQYSTKCKQRTKQVALKAADLIKGDDETSAIVDNTDNLTDNNVVVLKIELIPVHYLMRFEI